MELCELLLGDIRLSRSGFRAWLKTLDPEAIAGENGFWAVTEHPLANYLKARGARRWSCARTRRATWT